MKNFALLCCCDFNMFKLKSTYKLTISSIFKNQSLLNCTKKFLNLICFDFQKTNKESLITIGEVVYIKSNKWQLFHKLFFYLQIWMKLSSWCLAWKSLLKSKIQKLKDYKTIFLVWKRKINILWTKMLNC